MRERTKLMTWIRGDIVGPVEFLKTPSVATFRDRDFSDPEPDRRGSLAWRPSAQGALEEVLYYERESPHRKYGAGLLHPSGTLQQQSLEPDIAAAAAIDPLGADDANEDASIPAANGEKLDTEIGNALEGESEDDDFDVTSPDIRHPSTLGVSFCVQLNPAGRVLVRLPQTHLFSWQTDASAPISVNGRYERCIRRWNDKSGSPREAPAWRRVPAMNPDTVVQIDAGLLNHGKKLSRQLPMPAGSPISLLLEVFPRRFGDREGTWLLTAVLRNNTAGANGQQALESILYQTFFDVAVEDGSLVPYPESQRSFEDLDEDERSLALLYREAATWGIGHGCAAGWDADPGEAPTTLFADVMPAVQLPSMTADVNEGDGTPIQLSMRELSDLPASGNGSGWESLAQVATAYAKWIAARKEDLPHLSGRLPEVGDEHLKGCERCLQRINRGIELLRKEPHIRRAFELANVAMLLQQIATKKLARRPLECVTSPVQVRPAGKLVSPWEIYSSGDHSGVGSWRAFQIAFLLMSLEGVSNGDSADREIVDLIWFPTGGGKTEAYLAVMAFHLFHERLRTTEGESPRRDGTNVLMRYTLRMLTTQQFQRAAALICAMEHLRRNPVLAGGNYIPGGRFSLGLWIGGDGSPNSNKSAREEIKRYTNGHVHGNPLVLTECPWCRAGIGRYDGTPPPRLNIREWNNLRLKGLKDTSEGPMLHCSDPACPFGKQDPAAWLPVEVIDERIYATRPSVVIGTVDKLAMLAYRPAAGALFGYSFNSAGEPAQTHSPPSLIVQDELHLISGPLGTMYALYESIFERMCSLQAGDSWIKPKLIASTATIRGASGQVKSLYDRSQTQLFPSPGLLMGDSFFGKYARDSDGRMREGRLYLGIHATDYGSILTTQVRAYSSALFRPFLLEENRRDPWWTLLTFYNSIRELGGAKTLFESDIRSRLKFIFNREGFGPHARRNLRIPEELTSRLSQAEIVGMMDKLTISFTAANNGAVDACLASSIIEVGVDIDRLSLMGVVGQPKTTAQYIQVTGRVGRRWWERPGLIMMIYNPSKSRDRSHFEQFHSYHRRLYERVEPTSATPFAVSAIERALPGAVIAWARQKSSAAVSSIAQYQPAVEEALAFLVDRCESVQVPEDRARSIDELQRACSDLLAKWKRNPQQWEEFPPSPDGRYLMLWPGQYRTVLQEQNGVMAASSMRQVDASAELQISPSYSLNQPEID